MLKFVIFERHAVHCILLHTVWVFWRSMFSIHNAVWIFHVRACFFESLPWPPWATSSPEWAGLLPLYLFQTWPIWSSWQSVCQLWWWLLWCGQLPTGNWIKIIDGSIIPLATKHLPNVNSSPSHPFLVTTDLDCALINDESFQNPMRIPQTIWFPRILFQGKGIKPHYIVLTSLFHVLF